MALGQIVAYKRLWRENLIDGETQIPRSERNSQRARISGDRFTSLFEVKNCPTNGGKLNLVERWFGEITRKRIRRGVFKSVPELVAAIQDFIRLNNQNAKPFVWTKKVEEILEKVNYCKAVIETPH